MAKGSLRRFDVQAKWAVWFSLLSIVPFLGALGVAFRNWKGELRLIVYGHPAIMVSILGGCGLAMLLSFFGVVLGFNSAGQRRNDRQRQSWAGFFLGAVMLALALILLAGFWLLRQPIVK